MSYTVVHVVDVLLSCVWIKPPSLLVPAVQVIGEVFTKQEMNSIANEFRVTLTGPSFKMNAVD